MKTIARIFAAVAIMLAAASCTKEVNYNGVVNDVIDLDIRANQWDSFKDENGNRHFFCTFDVKALTSRAYDEGVIACYREFREDGIQAQLPYVRHFREGDFMWTETTYFEFSPGTVTIFFDMSDYPVDQAPVDMHFRLVISY